MCNALMCRHYNGWHMSPLKSAPSIGESGPHGSLDPRELVPSPNGILISGAVFAQLTHVPNKYTDRHTDHAKCGICSNKPHLRSACRQCDLKISWTPLCWIPGRRAQWDDTAAHAVSGWVSSERTAALVGCGQVNTVQAAAGQTLTPHSTTSSATCDAGPRTVPFPAAAMPASASRSGYKIRHKLIRNKNIVELRHKTRHRLTQRNEKDAAYKGMNPWLFTAICFTVIKSCPSCSTVNLQ